MLALCFFDKILQDKKGAVDQAPFSIYLMFGKRFSLNYLLLRTPRSMNGRGVPACCSKGVSFFGVIATHLSRKAWDRDTFSRNRPVRARARSPFLSQQSRRLKY